jgi:hypothetical protein
MRGAAIAREGARQVSLGGEGRSQLSPRLQKQRWPVAIPKMTMSNVMNQSAPRTSWVIVSSRTGLDSAVSSAVYALSREVSCLQ